MSVFLTDVLQQMENAPPIFATAKIHRLAFAATNGDASAAATLRELASSSNLVARSLAAVRPLDVSTAEALTRDSSRLVRNRALGAYARLAVEYDAASKLSSLPMGRDRNKFAGCLVRCGKQGAVTAVVDAMMATREEPEAAAALLPYAHRDTVQQAMQSGWPLSALSAKEVDVVWDRLASSHPHLLAEMLVTSSSTAAPASANSSGPKAPAVCRALKYAPQAVLQALVTMQGSVLAPSGTVATTSVADTAVRQTTTAMIRSVLPALVKRAPKHDLAHVLLESAAKPVPNTWSMKTDDALFVEWSKKGAVAVASSQHGEALLAAGWLRLEPSWVATIPKAEVGRLVSAAGRHKPPATGVTPAPAPAHQSPSLLMLFPTDVREAEAAAAAADTTLQPNARAEYATVTCNGDITAQATAPSLASADSLQRCQAVAHVLVGALRFGPSHRVDTAIAGVAARAKEQDPGRRTLLSTLCLGVRREHGPRMLRHIEGADVARQLTALEHAVLSLCAGADTSRSTREEAVRVLAACSRIDAGWAIAAVLRCLATWPADSRMADSSISADQRPLPLPRSLGGGVVPASLQSAFSDALWSACGHKAALPPGEVRDRFKAILAALQHHTGDQSSIAPLFAGLTKECIDATENTANDVRQVFELGRQRNKGCRMGSPDIATCASTLACVAADVIGHQAAASTFTFLAREACSVATLITQHLLAPERGEAGGVGYVNVVRLLTMTHDRSTSRIWTEPLLQHAHSYAPHLLTFELLSALLADHSTSSSAAAATAQPPTLTAPLAGLPLRGRSTSWHGGYLRWCPAAQAEYAHHLMRSAQVAAGVVPGRRGGAVNASQAANMLRLVATLPFISDADTKALLDLAAVPASDAAPACSPTSPSAAADGGAAEGGEWVVLAAGGDGEGDDDGASGGDGGHDDDQEDDDEQGDYDDDSAEDDQGDDVDQVDDHEEDGGDDEEDEAGGEDDLSDGDNPSGGGDEASPAAPAHRDASVGKTASDLARDAVRDAAIAACARLDGGAGVAVVIAALGHRDTARAAAGALRTCTSTVGSHVVVDAVKGMLQHGTTAGVGAQKAVVRLLADLPQSLSAPVLLSAADHCLDLHRDVQSVLVDPVWRIATTSPASTRSYAALSCLAAMATAAASAPPPDVTAAVLEGLMLRKKEAATELLRLTLPAVGQVRNVYAMTVVLVFLQSSIRDLRMLAVGRIASPHSYSSSDDLRPACSIRGTLCDIVSGRFAAPPPQPSALPATSPGIGDVTASSIDEAAAAAELRAQQQAFASGHEERQAALRALITAVVGGGDSYADDDMDAVVGLCAHLAAASEASVPIAPRNLSLLQTMMQHVGGSGRGLACLVLARRLTQVLVAPSTSFASSTSTAAITAMGPQLIRVCLLVGGGSGGTASAVMDLLSLLPPACLHHGSLVEAVKVISGPPAWSLPATEMAALETALLQRHAAANAERTDGPIHGFFGRLALAVFCTGAVTTGWSDASVSRLHSEYMLSGSHDAEAVTAATWQHAEASMAIMTGRTPQQLQAASRAADRRRR